MKKNEVENNNFQEKQEEKKEEKNENSQEQHSEKEIENDNPEEKKEEKKEEKNDNSEEKEEEKKEVENNSSQEKKEEKKEEENNNSQEKKDEKKEEENNNSQEKKEEKKEEENNNSQEKKDEKKEEENNNSQEKKEEKKEEKNDNSQEKQDEKKNEIQEPKKGMGTKFLSLIKTKYYNFTNKVSNYRKERKKQNKEEQNIKDNEEKKEELIELKEKIENNQEKEAKEKIKEESKEEKKEISEGNNNNNNNVNEVIKENKDEIKVVSEEPLPQNNSTENTNNNSEEKKEEKIEEKNMEKKDEFSKEELKKLSLRFHTILQEAKKLDIYTKEITALLDELTEFLIHGDKNDQELIDVFISLNFLYDILCMLGKMNTNINIQIIKFFSVLMTNLSEKNFNYFLFNCDYINQIIFSSRETIDGDYLYYYINFIKALLFKINKENLKYFFHEDSYTFPLLVNCLKFYHHPDSMISNTVRTIILFILRMKNKQCIDYMCNLPMISYFVFITCRLRDEIKTLNKKITRGKSESSSILHERICNDILYFQDIFSINIEKINFILTNCIFHFLILPTLCNSLIIKPEETKKYTMMEVSNDFGFFDYTKNLLREMHKGSNNLLKDCISKDLALYIFNLFFKYIKYETFLNALISILFLPKIHYKILEKLKNPVKDLFNYKGDFEPKAKNKFYLEKFIIENYTPPYMRGLLSTPRKIFLDLNKIEKKLQEKCQLAKVECNLNMSVPYGFYMELINDYFSRSGLRECKNYHQTISEATGIQCGLSFHDDRKCILYLLNKNLKYIKNDFSFDKVKNKYFDNIINRSFMDEFRECKILYLLLMYNYLFDQILSNNIISKELLAHVELLNPNEIHKNKKSNIEEEDVDSILKVGDLIKSNEESKKNKNNINKNINFSNISKVMYYKDFSITEFNLYSNAILSKYFHNVQKEYNSTIFGVILTFLNSGDVLRPEIYLFLTKLINDLIVYEDNNKKHLLKLRDYHVTIIKNIFKRNVENIIKRMNKIEISEDDLKKIFEFFPDKKEEGENKFAEYELIIHDFMEDCLFLMNKKHDEKDKTYNEKLGLYNKLNIENLELKIRIYFLKLFFDIYNGLFEGKIDEIKMEELTEDNKSNLKEIIVNNFNKLINKDNK